MSREHCAVVILGAAVWPGGVASNAIRRRVRGALASAAGCKRTTFIASGAVGRYPPSEARVMADLLLQHGVAAERIVLDEVSRDTLESVRNCSGIIAGLTGVTEVVVCSDTYHIPRCRWLFHLCGICTSAGLVENGRTENTLSRWIYYCLREAAAIPWDTLAALTTRGTKHR